VSAILENLRASIGAIEGHTLREHFPFSSVIRGIPRGAVTNIYGIGKTEITLGFLAENQSAKIAWIEDRFSIFPCGVLQRKVDLDRILFSEAGREYIWTALQVLRSQIFQIVVVLGHPKDQSIIRRLQLTAEKSNVALILLSDSPIKAWGVSLAIRASRSGISQPPKSSIVRQR
jgi:hypothetical protein